MKLKPVAEQTIVITGATSGVGLATAQLAAKRGARVILIARDETALAAVADDLRAAGGRADFIAADVGSREQVRAAADRIIADHGGFDSWANIAGVGVYARLWEISDEDHRRVFDTNYWGVVHGSTEAVRHLKDKGGAIINMGSVTSELGTPLLSSYAASKHAVLGFTDSLRMELMREQLPVSVTIVMPVGLDTPFTEHALNRTEQKIDLPPPIYAPELAAEAVVSATASPQRSIIVGGAGKLQTIASDLAPALSDIATTAIFSATAVDGSEPPQQGPGVHEPGTFGKVRGDYDGYVRETSLYTAARTRLPRAFGSALAGGLLAGLGAAWLFRPRLADR